MKLDCYWLSNTCIIHFLYFLSFLLVRLLNERVSSESADPQQFLLCTHQLPSMPLSPLSKQPIPDNLNAYSNLNDRVIGILPAPGSPPSQLLLTEALDKVKLNSSTFSSSSHSPFDPTTCAIRLEACPHCLISVELKSSSAYFTEFQVEKLSRCDDSTSIPLQPCFNFIIVEEKADHPLALQSYINLGLHSASSTTDNSPFYRQFSLWDQFHERVSWFNSTGSSLLVLAVMRNLEADAPLFRYIHSLFPLKILVVENSEIIEGQPTHSIFLAEKESSIGFIESPRFPEPYPRVLHKNYTLINKNTSGFVRVVFDDFHVHYLSELKILDSNGKELFSTRKEHRRPPALVSSGRKLTLMFASKDFTQIVGFKARYEFVDSRRWLDKPTTKNCDNYLESYGGRISLDGQKQLVNSHIDCVWLIGRFPAISRTFDQIYLSVEEFHLRGSRLRLEVRKGTNSGAERVLLLFNEHTAEQLEQKQPVDGFLTDYPQPAYYIRLRGFLRINQGLSIIFTHFYRWATALCPGVGEFHCDNSKCVKSMLRCDGFDHCGDGSDELCTIPDIVLAVDSFSLPNMLTIVVGVLSIIIILLMLIALASTAARNHLLFQLGLSMRQRRQRNDGNDQRTAAAQNIEASISTIHQSFCSDSFCLHSHTSASGNLATLQVPNSQEVSNERPQIELSIQTAGQRRFFILPSEHQMPGVIEAPPTYADALKHPSASTISRENVSPRPNAFTSANFTASPLVPRQMERSSQSSPIQRIEVMPGEQEIVVQTEAAYQTIENPTDQDESVKSIGSKIISSTWPSASKLKRLRSSGTGNSSSHSVLQMQIDNCGTFKARQISHSCPAKQFMKVENLVTAGQLSTDSNKSDALNRKQANEEISTEQTGDESWV